MSVYITINIPQMIDYNFFNNPKYPMHRKYEALRASYLENLTDSEVADKFGYSYFGYKSILSKDKGKSILFPLGSVIFHPYQIRQIHFPCMVQTATNIFPHIQI